MAAGSAPSRVEEVLELVGLMRAAGRRVGDFSLGMRQRLGLAAALLPEPEVLILDEPANGLDPEGVRWLRDLLRAQAAEGRTVLVSSHLLAEVAQSVDSVVILDQGRLVTQSTLRDLGSTDLEEAFLRLTAPREGTAGREPGPLTTPPPPAPDRRWLLAPFLVGALIAAFLLGRRAGRIWP